jgi:hypothetical protein
MTDLAGRIAAVRYSKFGLRRSDHLVVEHHDRRADATTVIDVNQQPQLPF